MPDTLRPIIPLPKKLRRGRREHTRKVVIPYKDGHVLPSQLELHEINERKRAAIRAQLQGIPLGPERDRLAAWLQAHYFPRSPRGHAVHPEVRADQAAWYARKSRADKADRVARARRRRERKRAENEAKDRALGLTPLGPLRRARALAGKLRRAGLGAARADGPDEIAD